MLGQRVSSRLFLRQGWGCMRWEDRARKEHREDEGNVVREGERNIKREREVFLRERSFQERTRRGGGAS